MKMAVFNHETDGMINIIGDVNANVTALLKICETVSDDALDGWTAGNGDLVSTLFYLVRVRDLMEKWELDEYDASDLNHCVKTASLALATGCACILGEAERSHLAVHLEDIDRQTRYGPLVANVAAVEKYYTERMPEWIPGLLKELENAGFMKTALFPEEGDGFRLDSHVKRLAAFFIQRPEEAISYLQEEQNTRLRLISQLCRKDPLMKDPAVRLALAEVAILSYPGVDDNLLTPALWDMLRYKTMTQARQTRDYSFWRDLGRVAFIPRRADGTNLSPEGLKEFLGKLVKESLLAEREEKKNRILERYHYYMKKL